MRKLGLVLFLCCAAVMGMAQQPEALPYNYRPIRPVYRNPESFWMPDTVPNRARLRGVGALAVGSYTAAYGGIALAWYTDFPRTEFHFFNDNHEWSQIDKMGHALGGYQGARGMIGLLKWGGMRRKPAALLGGLTGFMSLVPIEIMDGYADKWGFSWGDIVADFSGGALAAGNELLWSEQRIQMKVSYHPTPYADARPDLFGNDWSKALKDYNGHTFWWSTRVHAFLPEGRFKERYPRWLNLAVGYGANGLLGGYDNGLTDEIRDREYRQYYISPDIDFTQIPTSSGFLDFLLGALNVIHLPAPALEYNGRHGFRWHWLYM